MTFLRAQQKTNWTCSATKMLNHSAYFMKYAHAILVQLQALQCIGF